MGAAVLAFLSVISGSTASCAGCHSALPDHAKLFAQHPSAACADCHRGVASATASTAAHAGLLAQRDTEAACAGCHTSGGATWARGLAVYTELGCAYCHHANGFGHVDAFGPPLDAIGLREPSYLRAVVARPSKFFPKTVMPPHHAPDPALFVYLRSLAGKPRPAAPSAALDGCSSCHAGTPRKIDHRCPSITPELACKRCHASGPPKSERSCLHIQQRVPECRGCHEVKP